MYVETSISTSLQVDAERITQALDNASG